MKKLTINFAFFFFLISLNAHTQDFTCKKEIIDICKNLKAEINNVTLKCLYDNLTLLSPKCHIEIPNLALKQGECMLETIAYCSHGKVPTNQLEDVKCLNENSNKLLGPCRKKLQEVKASGVKKFNDTLDKFVKGCPKEFAYCGDPNDPKTGACVAAKFKANVASPECRQFILDTMSKGKKR